MWVVQEYPDSHRVMRTHENGVPVSEPTEVERFPPTDEGRAEAQAYLDRLVEKKGEIDDVLAVEG